MQRKVKEATEKEQVELARLREDNRLFKMRFEAFEKEKADWIQKKNQMEDRIEGLQNDRAMNAKHSNIRDAQTRIDALREERDKKERQVQDLIRQVNKMSNQMVDVMAENRFVKKSLPANYGFDLE